MEITTPGRVHTVPARTRAIIELGDHLRGLQVQVVTLESTSWITGGSGS